MQPILRTSAVDGTQSISGGRHPLARATLAGGWLEDVRSTPTSVSIDGGVTLRVVVKAAIVCRRIIKGTPRAGLRGRTTRPQENEDEAAQDFMHALSPERRFLDTGSHSVQLAASPRVPVAGEPDMPLVVHSWSRAGRGAICRGWMRIGASSSASAQYMSANLRQCRAFRRDFAMAARRANSLAFAR